MLKNYILTAYKVLLRRKFFTFIGLFGIALTLAVLLVVSALIDNTLYPKGPEKNNAHFLGIDRLVARSEDGSSSNSSRPGYYFLKHNVARLKTPEKMSFFSSNMAASSYLDQTKISNSLKYTDIAYWEILDFDFIAGRAYDQSAYDRGAMEMVITRSTAKEFFKDEAAVGKSIVVDERKYIVVGVVEDISMTESYANADMWVPTTTKVNTRFQEQMLGGWEAIVYHSDPAKLKQIQAELIHLLQNDPMTTDPERYHTVISAADTALERIARGVTNSREFDSGVDAFIVQCVVLVILFMMLPSINLINLNISRIMERSSEIGVRKAYGASRRQLVIQFVVENILVTFIGAFIGFVLSYLVLLQIEKFQWLAVVDLSFSVRTFIYGIVLVLMFGLLSGAYPAYRMSKLHPVNALKGG